MGGTEGAWMRIFVETGRGVSISGCFSSGMRIGTDLSEGLNRTSEIFKRHVYTSVSMVGCLHRKKTGGGSKHIFADTTHQKQKGPTLTTSQTWYILSKLLLGQLQPWDVSWQSYDRIFGHWLDGFHRWRKSWGRNLEGSMPMSSSKTEIGKHWTRPILPTVDKPREMGHHIGL